MRIFTGTTLICEKKRRYYGNCKHRTLQFTPHDVLSLICTASLSENKSCYIIESDTVEAADHEDYDENDDDENNNINGDDDDNKEDDHD